MADSDVDATVHTNQQERQCCRDGRPRNPVPFEPSRFSEIEDSDNDENQEGERGLHSQCYGKEVPPTCKTYLTQQIPFLTVRLHFAQCVESTEKSWRRNQGKLRGRISPIVESATRTNETIDSRVRHHVCMSYRANREPVSGPNDQNDRQRGHSEAPI